MSFEEDWELCRLVNLGYDLPPALKPPETEPSEAPRPPVCCRCQKPSLHWLCPECLVFIQQFPDNPQQAQEESLLGEDSCRLCRDPAILDEPFCAPCYVYLRNLVRLSQDLGIPEGSPGGHLLEYLTRRYLGLVQLADCLGWLPELLYGVLKGEQRVTSDLAQDLERVTGSPAAFWETSERIFRAPDPAPEPPTEVVSCRICDQPTVVPPHDTNYNWPSRTLCRAHRDLFLHTFGGAGLDADDIPRVGMFVQVLQGLSTYGPTLPLTMPRRR